MTIPALQLFAPAAAAFLIGIGITPFVSHVLYTYKMWKPKAGKTTLYGEPATEFNSLHKDRDVGTPRFGGVIVWGSTILTAALFQSLLHIFPDAFSEIAFVSRAQTWVPLAAFIVGSAVGYIDDLYEVRGTQGVRLRYRLAVVSIIAGLCAYWFYAKLDVSAISVPFMTQTLELGVFFIPFFIICALFMYAGGVIDGIDGLAGGTFAAMFSAYAGIAFFQQQYDIASLCAAIVGGLLAFLWFNIPPARFYLSETGTMGLTVTLVIVAFLTDTLALGRGVAVLPIVALPLVVTVLSNIIQLFGKKLFNKKVFRIAPLHHHFEAIGWPSYKVTMRYWVVSVIAAIVGMCIALL